MGVYVSGRLNGVARVEAVEDDTGLLVSPPVAIPDGSVGLVVHDSADVFVAAGDKTIRKYMQSTGTFATVETNLPDAGYLVDGPDGSFIVGSGGYIVTGIASSPKKTIGLPDGGPFAFLGAFAFDPATRRLFVPQGAAKDGGGGNVLVITLP